MKKLILTSLFLCTIAFISAQSLTPEPAGHGGNMEPVATESVPPGNLLFAQTPVACPTCGTASSDWTPGMTFEPQCANDFMIGSSSDIHAIRWWNYYESGGTTGWRFTIYSDASCVPANQLAQWDVLESETNKESYCTNNYVRWATLPTSFAATAGTTYWLVIQELNPTATQPQIFWSADVVGTPIGCEKQFKSPYFGYPDWTPYFTVFGVYYENYFELYGAGSHPVPLSDWAIYIGIFLIAAFMVFRFRRRLA